LDAAFRIVTVYRSPDSDVDSTVVINGDLNLSNINWIDPVLVSSRDYCSTLFYTFLANLHLNIMLLKIQGLLPNILIQGLVSILFCGTTPLLFVMLPFLSTLVLFSII